MPNTWGQGSTWAWRKTRAKVLERDKHQCQLNYGCCIGLATQVDHIINLASTRTPRRDTVPMRDLQSVCVPCHDEKTRAERSAGHRPPWSRHNEPHPGLI